MSIALEISLFGAALLLFIVDTVILYSPKLQRFVESRKPLNFLFTLSAFIIVLLGLAEFVLDLSETGTSALAKMATALTPFIIILFVFRKKVFAWPKAVKWGAVILINIIFCIILLTDKGAL